MSTPAEKPEQTPKKPPLGKILYGIAVGVLTVVMAVAAGLYWKDSKVPVPAPTEQRVPATKPAPAYPNLASTLILNQWCFIIISVRGV